MIDERLRAQLQGKNCKQKVTPTGFVARAGAEAIYTLTFYLGHLVEADHFRLKATECIFSDNDRVEHDRATSGNCYLLGGYSYRCECKAPGAMINEGRIK